MKFRRTLFLVLSLLFLLQAPLFSLTIEINNDGDSDLFLTYTDLGRNVSPETIEQASKAQRGYLVPKTQATKLTVSDGILIYERKFGSNYVYKGKLVESPFKLSYSVIQGANLGQKSNNQLLLVPAPPQ